MILAYFHLFYLFQISIPVFAAGSTTSIESKEGPNALPEDSKQPEPLQHTYFSLLHKYPPGTNRDSEQFKKLEKGIQEINSEIDLLCNAHEPEFAVTFGRLLEASVILRVELAAANSDFAFGRAYVGSKILENYLSNYYMSKIPNGERLLHELAHKVAGAFILLYSFVAGNGREKI